jgi:hypothetical protein
MKPTYSQVITPNGDTVIVALYDNGVMLSIPMDEANSDYQAYLNKDKAEQSTPNLPGGN